MPTEHQSVLSSCITVWYGACIASCGRSLQRIVRAAETITGTPRLTHKVIRIAGDPTHPSGSLFGLLPSGRRLRSLWARTSPLRDSFYHQAARALNSLPALPPIPVLPPPHPNSGPQTDVHTCAKSKECEERLNGAAKEQHRSRLSCIPAQIPAHCKQCFQHSIE